MAGFFHVRRTATRALADDLPALTDVLADATVRAFALAAGVLAHLACFGEAADSSAVNTAASVSCALSQ